MCTSFTLRTQRRGPLMAAGIDRSLVDCEAVLLRGLGASSKEGEFNGIVEHLAAQVTMPDGADHAEACGRVTRLNSQQANS